MIRELYNDGQGLSYDHMIPLPEPTNLDSEVVNWRGIIGSWDAIECAEWFDIEIYKDSGYTDLLYSDTTLTNKYTFTGLRPSTRYYWRVKASREFDDGSAWVNDNARTTAREIVHTDYILQDEDNYIFQDDVNYVFELTTFKPYCPAPSKYVKIGRPPLYACWGEHSICRTRMKNRRNNPKKS